MELISSLGFWLIFVGLNLFGTAIGYVFLAKSGLVLCLSDLPDNGGGIIFILILLLDIFLDFGFGLLLDLFDIVIFDLDWVTLLVGFINLYNLLTCGTTLIFFLLLLAKFTFLFLVLLLVLFLDIIYIFLLDLSLDLLSTLVDLLLDLLYLFMNLRSCWNDGTRFNAFLFLNFFLY